MDLQKNWKIKKGKTERDKNEEGRIPGSDWFTTWEHLKDLVTPVVIFLKQLWVQKEKKENILGVAFLGLQIQKRPILMIKLIKWDPHFNCIHLKFKIKYLTMTPSNV